MQYHTHADFHRQGLTGSGFMTRLFNVKETQAGQGKIRQWKSNTIES